MKLKLKVPIPDKNEAANSYSEVKYSKPYLAINDDYYIQLRIQELRMCKQIRHIYYCEELFLVKHKSKHNCESAIFYNLTSDVVYSVCQFKYFYNTTVTPSVLDGGSIYFWQTCLVQKDLSVQIIFIWPILYLVTHMFWLTGHCYAIVTLSQA